MNIVIIVGHPASGFEEVEYQLQQCGMNAALPSQREGMSPKDINRSLCTAHQVPEPGSLTDEAEFRQIEAGVVWHGMALDLVLGNLEQELWGWSDSRCIFLLNYWKSLDPRITFILVYDEPQRALAEAALHASDELDENNVQRLLANWKSYNGAMLGFFLRNRDRCLMVHAQQVHCALEDHLAQLRSRLKAPPEVADAALREHRTIDDTSATPSKLDLLTAPLPRALHDALVLIDEEPSKAFDAFQSDPAKRFIIQGVLNDHPDCVQLYEELQSVANLPLNGCNSDESESELAWRALVGQRQFVAQILGELHRKYQGLAEESQISIHELQARGETSADELALVKGLLSHIRDELEKSHTEKMSLIKSSEFQAAEYQSLLQKEKEELTKQIGDIRKEKQELTKQIGDIRKEKQELTKQIGDVRKEKEELANQVILTATDSAQRIKRQLSYQLGYTIVSRSRTLGGCLSMPYAITHAFRDFKKNRQ